MHFILPITLLFVTACSTLSERQRSRDLQTEVQRAINDNGTQYADCAKKHQLFKNIEANIVRLSVDVKINHNGQIEEFKTSDTSTFPNDFLNCIYNVLEKTPFPKLSNNEVIQFVQPFIFRKP